MYIAVIETIGVAVVGFALIGGILKGFATVTSRLAEHEVRITNAEERQQNIVALLDKTACTVAALEERTKEI